ncbi:MAG TPA: hypothetical protein IAD02_03600 [Candidatus Enterousia intestinigallinarum]|uniref:Uncharacterized protein n=1 Tax=Candidatus Enterousia intestinigallinarum TaxID=2840790 RepID=A0A9D1FHB6_9PROT|nr:hypothetical protein [Candidatus Enterousia intestinigallinarum]
MKYFILPTIIIAIPIFISSTTFAVAGIRGICDGGPSDGLACSRDTDCPGGICVMSGGGTTCTASNCSPSAWTAYATGYERRTYRYCSTSTKCTSSIQYRCAAGYYGRTINGSSGCTCCPNSGSSVAGSTVITSCYLPSGTTGTDTSGTYTYTADCYYSN